MQPGSPEWIEASLARLERLEQQRDNHESALDTATDPAELKLHSEGIDHLDQLIRALYSELESYAGDEDDGEGAESTEGESVRTNEFVQKATPSEPASSPFAGSAPSPFGEPAASPFGQPAASPFGPSSAAPLLEASPGSFGGYETSVSSSYDDDRQGGGGGKWVVLGVLLLAGGGAGAWTFLAPRPPAAAPTAPNDPQVIKAPQVPDDTEGPKGAAGRDVERSSDQEYRSRSRGGGGGGGGGRESPAPTSNKGHDIQLKKTDDPLH